MVNVRTFVVEVSGVSNVQLTTRNELTDSLRVRVGAAMRYGMSCVRRSQIGTKRHGHPTSNCSGCRSVGAS